MRTLAPIIAAAFLASCATGNVTHDTAQARLVAWGALDGASLALDALAKGGTLHGPPAATAARDLTKATEALTAADAAASKLDFSTAAADVASATVIITSLQSLVAKTKGH